MLILALWTLFFLASLAMAIGAHVSGSLRLAERLRDTNRGILLAQAGLANVIRDLGADTNGWDAVTEPWSRDEERFRNVPLGDGAYTVSCVDVEPSGRQTIRHGLIDEERKVNLNQADTNLLVSFFCVIGRQNQQEAAELVGSIGRYWTTKNERAGVKDRQLTAKVETSYSPRQDGAGLCFESLNELMVVSGVTPELYDRVEPFCTVYGLGKVNINTASPEVLRALLHAGTGGDKQIDVGRWVEALIAFRAAGHIFELKGRGMEDLRSSARAMPDAATLDSALVRLRGSDISVRSTCFRGTVTARVRGHASDDGRIDFVYDRERGANVLWRRY